MEQRNYSVLNQNWKWIISFSFQCIFYCFYLCVCTSSKWAALLNLRKNRFIVCEFRLYELIIKRLMNPFVYPFNLDSIPSRFSVSMCALAMLFTVRYMCADQVKRSTAKNSPKWMWVVECEFHEQQWAIYFWNRMKSWVISVNLIIFGKPFFENDHHVDYWWFDNRRKGGKISFAIFQSINFDGWIISVIALILKLNEALYAKKEKRFAPNWSKKYASEKDAFVAGSM